ncbi:hypothetical protein [Vogesella alkaliphila]|uniref:hypothetical protein n=1 Tax=Vogesella alkaliphila TaxID=1193621 RepID=UPI0016770D5B|nr:hypothetical protein [Vogesella alkaliphila]
MAASRNRFAANLVFVRGIRSADAFICRLPRGGRKGGYRIPLFNPRSPDGARIPVQTAAIPAPPIRCAKKGAACFRAGDSLHGLRQRDRARWCGAVWRRKWLAANLFVAKAAFFHVSVFFCVFPWLKIQTSYRDKVGRKARRVALH